MIDWAGLYGERSKLTRRTLTKLVVLDHVVGTGVSVLDALTAGARVLIVIWHS
jgi:hypothetical protein